MGNFYLDKCIRKIVNVLLDIKIPYRVRSNGYRSIRSDKSSSYNSIVIFYRSCATLWNYLKNRCLWSSLTPILYFNNGNTLLIFIVFVRSRSSICNCNYQSDYIIDVFNLWQENSKNSIISCPNEPINLSQGSASEKNQANILEHYCFQWLLLTCKRNSRRLRSHFIFRIDVKLSGIDNIAEIPSCVSEEFFASDKWSKDIIKYSVVIRGKPLNRYETRTDTVSDRFASFQTPELIPRVSLFFFLISSSSCLLSSLSSPFASRL